MIASRSALLRRASGRVVFGQAACGGARLCEWCERARCAGSMGCIGAVAMKLRSTRTRAGEAESAKAPDVAIAWQITQTACVSWFDGVICAVKCDASAETGA